MQLHKLIYSEPTGKVQNFQANTINSTAIEVSWEALDERDRNGIIDYYSITYGDDTNKSVNVSAADHVTEFRKVFANLQKYKEYEFIIKAHNEKGFGPTSKKKNMTDEDGKLI